MIRISNLSKMYGNSLVLKNINIEISSPGLYVIKGKSGSGKSSLLNILSLVDEDYNGTFYLFDKNVRDLTKKEREDLLASSITYLFQEPKLIEGEDIKTNLEILSYKSPDDKYLKDILNKVGLKKGLQENVSILSKGERQRLMIVITILKDSPLILLDEITSGLDELNKKSILQIIKELSKHKIVILVTHDLPSIESLADHIFHIKDGQMERVEVKGSYLPKINPKNNDLSLIYFFKRSSKLFKKKKLRYFSLCVSLVISLFTLGLSLMTKLSVSEGMKESLSSAYNLNQLIVKKKDNEQSIKTQIGIDKEEINSFSSSYDDLILNQYSYYSYAEDNFFVDKDYFTLRVNEMNLKYDQYSFRNLVSYVNLSNHQSLKIYPEQEILEDDEVILGMPYASVSLICKTLNLSSPYIDSLEMYLKSHPLVFTGHFKNEEWGYDISVKFQFKAFFINSSYVIGHYSSSFNEDLLEGKIFQLSYTYNLKENDYSPWTMKKINCLELSNDDIDNFFERFINDEKMKKYSFHLVPTTYFNLDNDSTSLIYFTYKNKGILNLTDFEFLKKDQDLVSYLLCGKNSYYVDDKALLSGFYFPTYLSSSLEITNEFIDYNSFSSTSLGIYQSSLLKMDEDKFFSLSLLDSSKANYVRFDSYLNKNEEIEGRYPSSYREVLVSKRLYDKLNLSRDNNKIYLTSLTSIKNEGDKYLNNFESEELFVTGYFNSNELVLKQDNIFPLIISTCHFKEPCEDNEIDSILISFKVNASLKIEELNQKYPDYIFYSPLEEYLKEITNALNYLSLGLLIFSLIVMVSCLSLTILVNYLLLGETKKEISIYRFNGYHQKSNYLFYIVFNAFLIFLSIFISSLILLVTNLILPRIYSLFTGAKIHLLPFGIIVLTGVSGLAISTFFSYIKYSKMNIIKEIKEN